MAATRPGTYRHLFFGSLISIGIGVFFSSFYAFGRQEILGRILLSGAIIGFSIHLAISLLQFFFRGMVNRLPRRPQLFAHAVIFIVGGIAGWISGMMLSSGLLGRGMHLRDFLAGSGLFSIGLIATIAVVVGFVFYSFETMYERLKEHEWAEKELELARKIQKRLLPPALIEGDGYTIAARNLPAHFVAGDFYDVVPLDDGSVVIIVADVAGKGIGASLIMASVKAVLAFVVREAPAKAMQTLNRKLVQDLDRREFVALAFTRFRPADGSVELLNAGFPDPYLISRDGVRVLSVGGPRLPLGIREDLVYESLRATINPGERLVFVSDGIPEAPARGEPLGYERLAQIIGSVNGSGAAWLDAFIHRVKNSVDEKLDDDWTAVIIER